MTRTWLDRRWMNHAAKSRRSSSGIRSSSSWAREGKGTGAGTMFPLAQIAREQKKLVIPIFVRPSFERHEVDKRHYDHAVSVIEQFDRPGSG